MILHPDTWMLVPPLYSGENKSDSETIVGARLVCCRTGWIWYVLEMSPVDDEGCQILDGGEAVDVILYCLVNGFDCELGYVSLRELSGVGTVEQDLLWRPVCLSDILTGRVS